MHTHINAIPHILRAVHSHTCTCITSADKNHPPSAPAAKNSVIFPLIFRVHKYTYGVDIPCTHTVHPKIVHRACVRVHLTSAAHRRVRERLQIQWAPRTKKRNTYMCKCEANRPPARQLANETCADSFFRCFVYASVCFFPVGMGRGSRQRRLDLHPKMFSHPVIFGVAGWAGVSGVPIVCPQRGLCACVCVRYAI